MGRPRKHRKDLPERVYYNHGAYYFIHASGKWEKLSNDYAQAMAAWAKLIERPLTASTVGELLDRYLIEVVPSKAERTQKDNAQEIRFLRAFFGGMLLTQVDATHVAQYIDNRVAKTRGNREIALLSHAFNKAIRWGLVKFNPCATPGLRNRERARDRYVTDEEIETFKTLCPTWLQLYIELKLLLGLRQQDMLALTWEQVDNTGITIWVRKTNKRLRVLLSDELQTYLNALSTSSKTLFQTKSGEKYSSAGFSSIWRRRMDKWELAGNPRFHEHDLRGKVATDIEDPFKAQQLLGHAKVSMTEQYIKQRKTDVVQPHSRRSKNGHQ